MEVISLVGPSGTGKSHRAMVMAHRLEVQVIIDDGLLIQGNRILAGASAKRQPTRIGAIKAALFMDEKQAGEVKDALESLRPEKIMILGTSDGMVARIASRLSLPEPVKKINIGDIATEKEIEQARYIRKNFSKHVIPAPTLEVAKSFRGAIVAPIRVFLSRKEGKGPAGKKTWLEQSVVRPTFTYYGKLVIANNALSTIAEHAASSISGVNSKGRVTVSSVEEGVIVIDMAPSIAYGSPLREAAEEIQKAVKHTVEDMTGLLVKEVNVNVRNLSFPKDKAEAN
ncbi:MAG: Asp23/Gls24 family envelope stress response protein [Eubacteriales bacterium]